MKRPWVIYGLIIVFAASLAQGVKLLSTIDYSFSNAVFSFYGLGPVFQVIVITIIILDAATIYFLIRPIPVGYRVAVADMILSMGINVWTLFLGIGKLDLIRDTYLASREAQGLPTHSEQMEVIFSPRVWLIMGIFYLAFECVILGLVIYKRSHFQIHKHE